MRVVQWSHSYTTLEGWQYLTISITLCRVQLFYWNFQTASNFYLYCFFINKTGSCLNSLDNLNCTFITFGTFNVLKKTIYIKNYSVIFTKKKIHFLLRFVSYACYVHPCNVWISNPKFQIQNSILKINICIVTHYVNFNTDCILKEVVTKLFLRKLFFVLICFCLFVCLFVLFVCLFVLVQHVLWGKIRTRYSWK